MLTLLWGRAGSGKTTRIAHEICERASKGEEGLIWLVPEPFSHECERLLARTGGPSVCLNAEVLTFGRMADRVLAPYGGAQPGVLDEGGRLLTMRLAVDSVRGDLSLLARNAHRPAFLTSLLKTADECKCYAIPPETLYAASESASGSAALKLRELALIFAAYDAALAQGSVDPRDRITLLAKALDTGRYAADKHLYVDSFVTFTPQECRVIEAFIRHGRGVTAALTGLPDDESFTVTRMTARALRRRADETAQILLEGSPRYEEPGLARLERHFFDTTLPASEPSGALRAVCAPSPSGECAFIARAVRDLTAGGMRYRDIVVAVNDLPKYGPLLEQAFEREGIPVFMDGMDEVSAKPLFRFLKASADIVTRGWRTEDVLALLNTGLFRASRPLTDRLEGYLRRWKPEGRRWRADWTMHPRGYVGEWTERDLRALRMFNRMRALIYAPLSLLKNGKTAQGWTDALLAYLRKARVQTALSRRMKALRAHGELKAAAECAQLWEILLSAMWQCAAILGQSPMDLATYMELLLLVLSGAKVGSIPVALDRVGVAELGRLRRVSARAVFVPGCDAESMPDPGMPESLISVEERAALEAVDAQPPPDAELRLLRENYNLYAAFSLPSSRLFLSFSQAPGGETLPADALTRACRLLGADIELLPPSERAWSPPPDLRAPLSRDSVEALYGREIRLSATRLERALECKFSFFCRYGLRAKPDAEPGYSPLDMGLFIHEVLEKAGRRVQQAGGARLVPPETVRAWAEEAARAYAERVLRGGGDYGQRFRRRFEGLVRSASAIAENVNEELARSEFSPLAFELSFGGRDPVLPAIRLPASPEGFAFLLEGKIDRADIWRAPDGRTYVRVADYKTGEREFSLAELYYGKGIQLPLYLFALARQLEAAEGGDVEPAGMLYIPARRPLLPSPVRLPESLEQSGLEKSLRREGLLLADEAVLAAMGATPDSPSPFLPVAWKKGALSLKSAAPPDRMRLLSEHVDRLVHAAAQALASGDVRADPLSGKTGGACQWCDYARCCYFSDKTDCSRAVEIKDALFWQALGDKAQSDGGGEAE